MNRTRCLVILLLVVLGNAMIGVHAATHAQTDLGQCELCAAYGDPADSISNDDLPLPAAASQAHRPDCLRSAKAPAAVYGLRPRGPPPAA